MARHSEFKPEYCEMLIKHMKKGFSIVSFAGVIGVTERTLHNWFNRHPEFAEARDVGTSQSLYFWEKLGIEGAEQGKHFNAAVWIFNMRNRFGWKNDLPEAVQQTVKVFKIHDNEPKPNKSI